MIFYIAARLCHGRGIDRVTAIRIAHEVQRQTIGTPCDVALTRFAFTHSSRRTLLFGCAYEDIAVGHEGHRLAIRRECDLIDIAPDGAEFAVDQAIVGRSKRELLGNRAFFSEIDAPQVAEHRDHRTRAIERDCNAMNVHAIEVGETSARINCSANLGAVQIERTVAAIRDVHELIRANETRHAIVAVVLGELLEALRRGLIHPHVAIVRAVISAATPRRTSAFEENTRAIR